MAIFREETDQSEFAKRQNPNGSDLDEQLREYVIEWRKQRAKEEQELNMLKEKQAKRRLIRAEEEKKIAERNKQEEERHFREMEEKKKRAIEEKRQRLVEAEKKRQVMLQSFKDENKSTSFKIPKRNIKVVC